MASDSIAYEVKSSSKIQLVGQKYGDQTNLAS